MLFNNSKDKFKRPVHNARPERQINQLVGILLFVCSTLAISNSTFAKDRLNTNESLLRGQTLTSSNGSYRLAMQTDGNLVVYSRSNKAIWHTQTNNTDASKLIMQSDGNLVLYSNSNNARWHTHTDKRPDQGIHAVIQNDGNFVLYTGANKAIWDSMGHTRPKPTPAPPSGDSNVSDYSATVTASTLNVRSGPSSGYSIIGKKYRNQPVTVTHHHGAWRRIAWAGGRKAYVYGSHIEPNSSKGAVPTPSVPSSSPYPPNFNPTGISPAAGVACEGELRTGLSVDNGWQRRAPQYISGGAVNGKLSASSNRVWRHSDYYDSFKNRYSRCYSTVPVFLAPDKKNGDFVYSVRYRETNTSIRYIDCSTRHTTGVFDLKILTDGTRCGPLTYPLSERQWKRISNGDYNGR